MLNNEYYSQVFHEMKNSVTLINSYLQLIEKNHPEISDFKYWITSKNETARLRAITTELSQVKLGTQLTLEPVDLRDFMADCCYGFHCLSEREEMTYTLTMSDTPIPVLIDVKQLRLAIVNLLKNSCEAMNQQGLVVVEALPERGHATVRITDTGCGISADIIEKVFDPFVSTKEDGSGLGLNITRQIVTAHGGTIFVSSTEHKGSTFTLTLPCHTYG